MNQPYSRFLRLVGLFAIASVLAAHLSHAARAEDAATFEGTVVDEQDAPLAGVTVQGMPSLDEQGVMSDADGRFRLPLPNSRYAGLFLITAKHEDGRQGVFQWKQGTSLRGERTTDQPIRIVLKKPREVAVEVVDSAGLPVEGAQVALLGVRILTLSSGVTDHDGRWNASVPADVMFDHIIAFKAGAGLDHLCTLEEPRSNKYKPMPDKAKLKLAGTRSVRVRIVDSSGEPIPNVGISFDIRSEGQVDAANTSGWKPLHLSTDATGTVSFDWLSPNAGAMVVTSANEFGRSRPTTIQRGPGPVDLTFQLVRRAKLSGHVLFANGRPATSIRVEAGGESVLTDASGAYQLFADGNKSHIVSIVDDKWAAPSHVGVLVSEGQNVPGLDFTLSAGAVIRGQVRVGPEHLPLTNNTVYLTLEGGPAEPTGVPGPPNPTRAFWATKTDQEGNYRLCVFPGTYELRMISPVRPLIVTLSEQADLVRDFHFPRAPLIGLEDRVKGTVVDEHQQPIADAIINGTPRSKAFQNEGAGINRTNREGKFDFLLPLIPVVLHAQTSDGRMAGIVRIETDEAPRVIRIAPTATAHGRLLNDKGQAVAGARLQYGIRVHEDVTKPNGPAATSFGGIVITSAEGRFELRSLVPGEEYALESEAEPESNSWSPLSTIKAVKPAAVELGDIRLRPTE